MLRYTVLLLPVWLSSVVSTTHYYELSVGYMTGAPDGLRKTMLGKTFGWERVARFYI